MKKLLLILVIPLLMGAGCNLQKEPNKNRIEETIKCAELLELKKLDYFGSRIGQLKYVYNEKIDTCLVVNLYTDFENDSYDIFLKDLVTDKTLLYYYSWEADSKMSKAFGCDNESYEFLEYISKSGEEVEERGCDSMLGLWEKSIKIIKDYNLEINTF